MPELSTLGIQVVQAMMAAPPSTVSVASNIMPMAGTYQLSALRVVHYDETGSISYASSDSPEHAYSVAGITLDAGKDSVRVQRSGPIEDASWNWIPYMPVVLGLNGGIAQIVHASSAFALVLGVALTPKRIAVRIAQPIFL